MARHDTDARWTLAELTQEAGVSVRTVRYYIAEGLLPPPDAHGPRAFYTQGHLDRLLLIDRLKAHYLPLKEIRRRLSALDDTEIRRLLATNDADFDHLIHRASTPPSRASPPRPADSATDYIGRLLHAPEHSPARAPGRRHRIADSTPPAPSAPIEYDIDHDLSASDTESFSRLIPPPPAAPAIHKSPNHPETAPADATWRRIPLSDDVELLIRDDTYHRKRDRVQWLIDWARKVFN